MDPVGKILGTSESRCPSCKKHIMSSDMGYWNCGSCGFECSYGELETINKGDKRGKELMSSLVGQYKDKGWMK